MAAARNYSSVARLAALTGAVTNSATTFAVDVATGFPTPPFTMVVDPGRTAEEIVTVSAVVGLSLTVIRGQDGTAGQPHDAGAQVRHMATARDFRDAAEHIALLGGVHGVAGDLVGTVDDQIMDHKTFTALITDHTPITFKAAAAQTAALLSVQDSSGTVLGLWAVSGRLTAAGIDAGRSYFTSTGTGIQALVARGASGQSANIFEVRNSSDTALAWFSYAGGLVASGIVTGTGSTAFPAIIINCILGQTASSLSIRNSLNTEVAGVSGETTNFQLFHGGNTNNRVPFRVHGGTATVVMLTGATSWSGSIDLSSYGFTSAPLMSLTVRQDNLSALQRRVTVNIENPPSTTACTFRVVQTSADVMITDTTYVVHWIAYQFLPSSAAG